MKLFRILVLCLLPLFGFAQDMSEPDPDVIIVSSNEVINHDFFAYGKSIEISGTINGDVYIFGGQVLIDGTVNGDIIAIGGSVHISGNVTKDIRLIAGQVMLSGKVGRNISAIAGNIELFPSAVVNGSIVVLTGNMDLGAVIKKNVRVYASNLRVSDGIDGNLKAYVGQMRLTSKANVKGTVEYWSNKPAYINPQAKIGEVVHHPSFFYSLFQGKLFKSLKIGSKLATLFMNFFYTLIIGIILIRFFPQNIKRSVGVLKAQPIRALICGLVVVIIMPIAFIALLISILGAPFALTLLALNVIGFYTVKIFFILWLLQITLTKVDYEKHYKLYFLVAVMVYLALTLIPYFGIALSIGAMLFGFGGLVLGKMQEKQPPN